jgi:hypothetical protein
MTATLTNRGRKPALVSTVGGTPAYVLLLWTHDRWGYVGPGYCGNGMSLTPLQPGGSMSFKVVVGHESHGLIRVGVDFRDPERKGWLAAVSAQAVQVP